MAIEITLLMDKDDVPKLRQAFREGRLDELGIIAIESASGGKAKPAFEWADKERGRHSKDSQRPKQRD